MRGAGLLVGLAGLAACAVAIRPGDPVPGLTGDERARFDRGRELFGGTFEPRTGLGPLFNSVACGECHEDPKPGGSGDEVELHVAAFIGDKCDPLVAQGGPVIQQAATPALRDAMGIDREPVPAEATAQARRSSPAVFGRGLLDLVPDSVILSFADPDDRNGDGISGRPNRFFDGRLGRFGRKALVPRLDEFNEGAYVAEQGVTTPGVPAEESIGGKPIPAGVDPVPEPEINQEAVDRTNDFVRFLASPPPEREDAETRQGRDVFGRIGCQRCHIPELVTGPSPTAALSEKPFAAYTDLLLHDMGPALADICLGLALPSEFRTEPLIGLRAASKFLHDGRTTSLEQAIDLHGGEATAARDRFRALSPSERAALLAFLKAL